MIGLRDLTEVHQVSQSPRLLRLLQSHGINVLGHSSKMVCYGISVLHTAVEHFAPMQIFPLGQSRRVVAGFDDQKGIDVKKQAASKITNDEPGKLDGKLAHFTTKAKIDVNPAPADNVLIPLEFDSEEDHTEEDGEGADDDAAEDSEADDDEDDQDNGIGSFQGAKFYTPPIAYLPLPKLEGANNLISPVINSGKRTRSSAAAMHKRQRLEFSKHLLCDKIVARLPADLAATDNYRQRCHDLYSALPGSHTGAPILSRLRRRLLRLAGHAIFAHHRGRHEVLFQTAFLFDLVILEFAKWTSTASCKASRGDGVQLSRFLREAASCQVHKTQPGKSSYNEKDELSRMTTTATCGDNASGSIDKLEVNEQVQSHIGCVSKEELRTVMMACLLVASKWNNSRYLPPDVLCSNPVGRVPLSTLLEFEIAILSLFEFDIPFQTSAMTHLHLLLGTCEEQPKANNYRKMVCHTCLMILEMALCDADSLKFSTDDLVKSASYLGVALTNCSNSWSDDTIPSLEELQTNSDQWWDVLYFHMNNVEFEMKSAMAALPRLEEMNRWLHPSDAPTVFGIDIARRHMLPQCQNFVPTTGDIADAKTKTESLALAYLNVDTCGASFDLLAAAALTEGHRLQYRVHCQNFELRCEANDRAFLLRKARQKWTKLRAEVVKHRGSAK